MSMSPNEARTEIKKLFEQADAIEKRYPDGLFQDTNAEDYTEVKRLLTEVDGLEAKLASLEDQEQRRSRIQDGISASSRPVNGHRHPQGAVQPEWKSPGALFTGSDEYLEGKSRGLFNSNHNPVAFTVPMPGVNMLESKALLRGAEASGGGYLVFNDVQRQPYLQLFREIMLFDLVPRIQTDSDTIEYVLETFTNAAAMTAEATASSGTTGTKPQSDITFTQATAPVKTLAHWIPVTNRMLADAPAIRGMIDNRLMLGLDLALETQMIAGDGNGENFTGLIGTSGLNIQGKGSDNEMDALYKGRTLVKVVGHGRPTAYALHPNDWQTIRLARENASTGTLGGYLMGPPSIGGPVTLWGIPVVESEAVTENTGLVGDWAFGAALFDREQPQIRVGLVNDQFIRNQQTILAELRAAFAVFRPSVFSKITGI